MAKKKRTSLAGRVGHTISDLANAASVAATGSELGVLELAAEDELHIGPYARHRKKKKKAAAKRPATRTSRKRPKSKRSLKRRKGRKR